MHNISKPFTLVLGGILLTVLGILLYFYIVPIALESKIKTIVSLENGTEALHVWEKPPPLEFKVYLFNVTNPNEVHNGSRPIVKEVGPYTYTEYHNKEIIQYHDEDDTISYNVRKVFYFNKEKSHPHNETDIVTIMNPALMGTVLMVQDLFPFILSYVDVIIPLLFPNQKTVFTAAPVKALLFDGITINCDHLDGFGKMACEGMAQHAPITLRKQDNSSNYLFSFFHHKNDTLIGPFRVSRGRKNVKELGSIKKFQGKDELDVWPVNSTCNSIQGTDATVFPPFAKKKDDLIIFLPDLCGTLFAEFDSDLTVNHINAYKYVGSSNNFADPLKYPQNKCRCEGIKRSQKVEDVPGKELICPKKGVMLLKKCYGAPIQFSQPHFRDADDDYIKYVEGLEPLQTGHETYVVLEPMTGIPIEGHKRLQINMDLEKLEDVHMLANVSVGLMPLIWIDESFTLGEKYMTQLTWFSYLVYALQVFMLVFVVAGFVLVCYTVFDRSYFQSMVSLSKEKRNTVHNHVAVSGACLNETLRIHNIEPNNIYTITEGKVCDDRKL